MSEYDSMLLYKCRWIAPLYHPAPTPPSFAWTEPSQPSMYPDIEVKSWKRCGTPSWVVDWCLHGCVSTVNPKWVVFSFCSAWIDEQNYPSIHKLYALDALTVLKPQDINSLDPKFRGLWIWKTAKIDVFSTKPEEVWRILDKQPRDSGFSSERKALKFLRGAY